jgi:hypothetical protein
MSKRYIILVLDVQASNVSVIQTFDSFEQSTVFLNELIDNSEYNTDSYKKYHDSSNSISIYKTNYIMPKTLIMRYFNLEYECSE